MKTSSLLVPLTALAALFLSGCSTNTIAPGTCIGNCVNGNGTLSTHDGQQYTGNYVLGTRQGPFEVRSPTGDVLNGTMVNHYFQGPVSIRDSQGHQFVQEFANGLPRRGASVQLNGDVYEGSFQTVLHPVQTTPAYGPASTILQPVTLFDRGLYKTATGETYEGSFSLADTQLVFRGKFTKGPQKNVTGLLAAPFTPGRRPGYAFVAVRESQVSEWVAAAGARLKAPATTTAPATNSIAAAAATLAEAKPASVASPAPTPKSTFNMIENNSGRYLSPITSDGVAAAWVDKSINASLGSSIGGMAGAYAGQKALEQVPFIGGFLGQKAGASAGRNLALQAVGGEAYLRQSSDISFNNINDMAGWLVQNYRSHAKFAEIMKAAGQIYPELTPAYLSAMSQVH